MKNNVLVIHDNMKITYDRINGLFDYVNEAVESITTAIAASKETVLDAIDLAEAEITTRLEAHGTEVLEDLAEVNATTHKIEEFISTPHNGTTRFSGCDGFDQDGDGQRDNCEEDLFPPALSVCPFSGLQRHNAGFLHAPDKIFESNDAAFSFLSSIVSASDDCRGPEDLHVNISQCHEANCLANKCQVEFNATAIQNGCRGAGTDVIGQTERFAFRVDNTAPTVSCNFEGVSGKYLFVPEGNRLVDTGVNVVVNVSVQFFFAFVSCPVMLILIRYNTSAGRTIARILFGSM